jgi:hypothetical protein
LAGNIEPPPPNFPPPRLEAPGFPRVASLLCVSRRDDDGQRVMWLAVGEGGQTRILKHTGGVFSPVYQQGDPGNGIGGYDLKSPADQAFAFDYDSSGIDRPRDYSATVELARAPRSRILHHARDRDDRKPQRLAGLHVEEARMPS